MPRITRPTQFSARFGIDPDVVAATGALDPILNADTRLFIDPLLLRQSKHHEMNEVAWSLVEKHFDSLFRLFRASRARGDVAWRRAIEMMEYGEIPGTCLGYGKAGVRGSAFGPARIKQLAQTASEIVAMGIDDPELFLLLPLIEKGVGADLVSDMTTNIILPALAAFTRRVARDLGVPCVDHELLGQHFDLPANPLVDGEPILLVPRDVLDSLPTASYWSDVATAAARNAELRRRVVVGRHS